MTVLCLVVHAAAHEGHDHDSGNHAAVGEAGAPLTAVTGRGQYRFRYNPDLSHLPESIARGIRPAHGGFAVSPDGEVYFGLNGTGLIKISGDLKEKTLLNGEGLLAEGGLHNTTYVDTRGGLLLLPDNDRGEIHVVDTSGEVIATLGRPPSAIDPYYGDNANSYCPTDAVVAPNGLTYILDGYSQSKFILAADLNRTKYVSRVAGGAVENGVRTPGKFLTCHGLTWDQGDKTLTVADRDLQRVQKFTLSGRFTSEFDLDGASPCDVEFVEWRGKSLGIIGCLSGKDKSPGVVHLTLGTEIVSTLMPKADLGLNDFEHIHHAIGVVVDGKLYVLCYGWNPGCFAVLEHIP